METDRMIAIEGYESELPVLARSKTDPGAFKPIYEKYFKTIFHFVHHRVGEKEASADITQQVFFKAIIGLPKYQFRGLPFSAWLFRIAINECNEYFRKTKRARLVVIEQQRVEQLYEELMAENSLEDLHQKLPDVLQKLQPNELQFIELRFFEGRPFKEIAEILEITENNAKVKTYRVLDKMKKLFLTR